MLRFDEYVERCLYHPTEGFYTSGAGVAGRGAGDFVTSPEVGPLFGAVLARTLDRWWIDLGRPDPFVVIDAGAGPGTLVKSLELAAPACAGAWELHNVDIASPTVPPAADMASLLGTEELGGAVVLANELLDNLPFRVVERGSADWREVFVDGDRELLIPMEQPPEFDLAVDSRAPLVTAATNWVNEVLAAGAARLLVFDYGMRSTEHLAERGQWLRTYRQHQRGDDPFHEPGLWDITTDVPFDQLPRPRRLETQADFLRRWGIEELVEAGRSHWAKHAASPDLTAFRMRSRVIEAEALLDPNGLGSWLVACWG